MTRIFSVRINIDDMAAQLDTCDSDAEKLQWLAGFRVGCRGLSAHTPWPEAKKTGAQFGLAAYKEAAAFAASQSAKGVKSALARKERHGSPQPDDNHGSTTVQPRFEPEGNQSSNPVIQESKNPKNEGNGRAPATPTPDLFAGMDSEATPVLLAAPLALVPMEINWRDWRSQHGSLFIARRGEDGDIEGWEEAWKVYGHDIFNAMYAALGGAGKRIYFNSAVLWFEENTTKEPA